MAERTLVIVNPASGNGRTGRRWKGLADRVRAALGPFEVESTTAPRDAARIAREGVRAGIERVIVAGGDGTVNEVADGLLGAGLGGYAQIGLLPFGTGGDFARALGVPPRVEDALESLRGGRERRIDAGRLAHRAPSGAERISHFVNIASFGISGLVDELANRSTKRFGGTVSFLIATLNALARYRSGAVTLRVAGEIFHDGPLTFATAANGRYFGGGMHVAPEASLDDGLLDVVVVDGVARHRLVSKLPMLYAGTHLKDPIVRATRGRVIEADAPPGQTLLDVDGEALGSLPARIEVLPAALRFFGGGA